MEHIYTIPFVRTVEERSGLNKVVLSATVYINTQETFEHTFEKQEYDMEMESTTVTVTEDKTVEHFQKFEVDFDTSNIDSSKFVDWDDLTEEEVIGWVKSVKDVTPIETEGAKIVAEKKDKILNPNKYRFDSPVTPWRVRADKAAVEAANAESEETN